MLEKKKTGGISRRKFLKEFGGGVAGAAVLAGHLPAAPLPGGKKAGSGAHTGQQRLALKVNGVAVSAMVESRTTLAEFLREKLNLTGTKLACNRGECGACTVLLDGRAVYSCQMLALDAAGREVTSIEGLLKGEELHPIQQAFVEHDGLQCGFCTPGQIMAAQGLLNQHPHPNREQVAEGMSGNLCRCAAYPKIIESVLAAAENNR